MLLFAGVWVLALSACGSDDTKAKNRSNGYDTTPPGVVTIKPVAGSVMLETNAIVVAYDEAMARGSLVLGGGLATESDGGVWSSDNETLTVKPATTWGFGLGRTLTVDAADEAGNDAAQVSLSYDIFHYNDFGDVANWAAFDPGANGVGTEPDGFHGGVFDGRYIYFIPNVNGTESHGEVLRYDTSGTFGDPASWDTFDAGANGVGTDPDGYVGGVFDGQYVYFAPHMNGTDFHGEVLRYDTAGTFGVPASWSTFDPGANGVGTDPKGYLGGVFDGRYVYFVPHLKSTGFHGEVMRYDTSGTFGNPASWDTFDAGANGVGTNPDGFFGGVFDGRYVYFVPRINGTEWHGEVMRYDTSGTFGDSASWDTFDAGANGVGTDPDGFYSGVFDGRYIYFVPYLNGVDYHGEIMRYDTSGAFNDSASWSTFDAGANGIGSDPDGFSGGAFDGRYVYFIPHFNGTEHHGEVLRYDTLGAFGDTASWSTFDAGANGVGTDPDGYVGGVFDGRYLYFVPWHDGVGLHGEVLRFDVKSPQEVPDTVFGGSFL